MTRTRIEDTESFHYYNANPVNRMTGDCAVRAIALAFNMSWEDAYRELFEFGLKNRMMLNDSKCIEKYLKHKGWEKVRAPKKVDGKKYTAEEALRLFRGKVVLANIGSKHIACIKDNKVWDTWNCTKRKVGNYWIKLL